MPKSTVDTMIRAVVHYSGQVQGVGFRYTTATIARAYPVVGYVQNLPDGRVFLAVEGISGDIESFLTAVTDRMEGMIQAVQRENQPPTREFTSFEIRH